MYCGDETGSFIGEIGSHTCRFGYGGEDNPKLTMPSYVVSNSNSNINSNSNSNSNGKNVGSSTRQRRRMSRFSSLHPPREEEIMESILRMPGNSSMHEHKHEHEPIVDPNRFLRQGEIVENWDNVQTAWEHSMNVLRATDTLKHTQGGMPYDQRSKKQQKREHASGLSSASVVGSKSEHQGNGRCVHPMLAITPGVSEYTSSASDGDGNNTDTNNDSDTNTGPKFQAAIRRQQHTQHIEMMMESLDATSAFLAPAPMLAAFSLGRQTALVVDIGAGGCRVTPIVDGLILKQSQRRSGRGGDWLGDVTWKALSEEMENQERAAGETSSSSSSPGALSPNTNAATNHGIKPRYMLTNRYEGKKQSAVFHRRAVNDLMYEIRTEPFVTLYGTDNSAKIRIPFADKRNSNSNSNPKPKPRGVDGDGDGDGDVTMASPPGTPISGDTKNNNTNTNTNTPSEHQNQHPPPPYGSPESTRTMLGDNNGEPAIYELPDGTPIDLTSSSFGKDLCQLPELLFAEESALPFRQSYGRSSSSSSSFASTSTLSNLPLHKLIKESLLAVGDVDVRKELAGCICLVGATSLFPNLEKRLSQELTALLPSFVRPKVVAPKISSVERSCASWIGASILTSLGSFQQLWLSRTEYEEYGAALSIQRFP